MDEELNVQNQDGQVEQQTTQPIDGGGSDLPPTPTPGELSYADHQPDDHPAEPQQIEPGEQQLQDTPPQEQVQEQQPGEDVGVAEEVPISTAQELVEHQEWDQDWFYGLKVPIKVDGESSEATIAEMQASFQTQQAAEHRLSEAKAKVTEANEAISQRVQTMNTGFGVVAGLLQVAEQLIVGETSEADLKQLEATDPTQYLIEKNRLEERQGAVNQLKQQLATAYLQSTETLGQQQQQDQVADVEAEFQALKSKLPAATREDDWNWDEKGEAYERVVSYMVDNDLPEELVRDERNHMLLVFAEKARLYDEMQAKVGVTEKRLTTVPKVLKPGANQSTEPKEAPKDPVSILYPNMSNAQ